MTRERPILFRPEMVREILAGRKTVTRRPVKAQLPDEPTKEPGKRWGLVDSDFYYCGVRCPYGVPGDRLWVRETFALSIRDPDSAFEPDTKDPTCWDGAVYRADGETGEWERYQDGKRTRIPPPWKPAIHMPRWASRLVLDVTEVRVERLHAITPAEAAAEGVGDSNAFMEKWDALYGGGEFAVRKNPWVWVVSFRRVEAGGSP